MKKIILALCAIVYFHGQSQIGVAIISPTNTLDVNGETRIRTLADIPSPNASTLLATDNSGVMKKTTFFDAIYSSGLYTRSLSNDNWNNIYVGTKACRLDFVGRVADSGIDFTFSVLYKIGVGFQVVSQNNVVIIPINATTFQIFIYVGAVYTCKLTLLGNMANMNAVKTLGGGWIQGTFRSIPILN